MAGYVTLELFSSDGDLLLEMDVAPQLLERLEDMDPELLESMAEAFENAARATRIQRDMGL